MSKTVSTTSVVNHDEALMSASLNEATPRLALSEQGKIVRANEGFCALIDADFPDIRGQKLLDHVSSIKNESGKPRKRLTQSGIYSLVFNHNPVHSQSPSMDFYFEWLSLPRGRRFLIGSFIGDPALLEHYNKEQAVATNIANLPEKNTLSAEDLSVFNSITHDCLVVLSGKGKILRANEAFNQIFHAQNTDKFVALFDSETGKNIKEYIKADTKHSIVFETALNHKSYPEHGGVTLKWRLKRESENIYALGYDISQLKAQQREVIQSKQQLREAEMIGRMGHWRWVIDGETITWSDEIYNLFGVDSTFIPSLDSMNEMISRRDLPRVNRAFQRAMIEHNNYDMEFQINRPDGTIRYVHCEGRCELDKNGELTALFGIMQDVTERVLYEKELRAAKTAAERSYAAKTQFLANMSHELRTPLNAILGFSQMMQQQLIGPLGNKKYLEYVDGIYDSGQHLLNIIGDILDMSKIEAGKYELALEEINVHETVKSAVRMVQSRAEESGIILSIQHESPDDLNIVADRRAVKQILLNILSNAIKFTKTGGSVTVETFAREGYLALKIKDTGIGIPANKLPYIMRPFEQVSHSYARDHDGTGLGLAITKDLVELHGGALTIDSEVGVGTTINIRLPYDAYQATKQI